MVFDSCTIGGISVSCPIVRSATFEGMADEKGHPKENLFTMYGNLVSGGVDIIITGMIGTSKLEPHQHHQLLLDDDDCIAPLKELTQSVHEKGGKVMAQLVVMGSAILVPEGENRIIISPSGVPEKMGRHVQESVALSKEQIEGLIGDVEAAARRAVEAGFDGIQFHGAHGYLASKFLTPYFNRRTDEYGGSLENRARFLRQCVAAIKRASGPSYPVWVKLNSGDFMKEGGMTEDESKTVMTWLSEDGVAAIEVSGGSSASLPRKGPIRAIRRTKEPMYFAPFAKEVATALKGKTDVGVVGGWRDVDEVEKALTTTDLAFISLCRPFIREPNLLKRWKEGNREPATCISCSRCFGDTDVDCIFHKREQSES